MRARGSSGYSLVELLAVTAFLVTLGAIAIPRMAVGLDDSRAAGAARYISGRLHDVRMEAVQRSTEVALRFSQSPNGYAYAVYADGNGNGVRTRDIQRGIDRQIQQAERLSDQFPGVDFGTIPGLPAVDSGSPPPGADPIKVGSSDMLSFSALGTSSSGSLYIRGGKDAQYVVRVFGETGKVRVLRFNARVRQWNPP